MGKGKGSPEIWVAVVRPGMVLIEVSGANPVLSKKALTLAAHKLPIKCRVVER